MFAGTPSPPGVLGKYFHPNVVTRWIAGQPVILELGPKENTASGNAISTLIEDSSSDTRRSSQQSKVHSILGDEYMQAKD
ncbi:hypothetical protein FS749_001612 [Ceratobasidium sp. UAMH 11750]|nr:hypothetical protein FS749_001612 [Ceratobasidium sp. UAMH 11750]